MNKKIVGLGILAASLLFANQAMAHAVVKPNTAGIGKFQTFNLGIPSEKPVATTKVRLVLPEGLSFIMPNVKPGWKIELKKQITGNKTKDDDGRMVDEQKITEIIWSGGRVPADQRDEFVFSAKVPSQPTVLNWKVYQTYADGTVISWDQDPNQTQTKNSNDKMDFSKFGPFSKTEVIDDLTPTTSVNSNTTSENLKTNIAIWLSVIATLIALTALIKTKKA
ncbi:MAG TPA: YcnI family protein [Candidatus Udaeobacter sp.]|nr:YcnI family protein [Candidatus Udaeobacter sp.]